MGKHCSDHAPAQHLSANFPHTPGSVPPQGMRGCGVLPSRSPFLKYLLPLSQQLVSSSYTPIHSELPSTQGHSYLQPSTVAPFPRRPLSLTHRVTPSGRALPLGASLPLSELSLFCTPQKTENPRRQGLFGLLCTNWVSGWPPRHKWDEYQRRVKPWLCPFLGPGCVRSWWNRVLASPGHHAGWMRQAGAPG